MVDRLTVFVAQSPGGLVGPDARLAWLAAQLGQGAASGGDLLVLPELFLTGYNAGEALLTWGEERHGPYAQRIAALAKQHGIAIHYSYAEKEAGQLYNAAACYGAQGQGTAAQYLGGHRKLLLPPGFEADHFVTGQDLALFALAGFKIATLICYDAEFPETFRQVVAAGADLVVVPTALAAEWGVVAHKMIPTRAFENGCFVCYANHCGEENGLSYLGASCVVAPNGQDLARAGTGAEWLRAELDRAAIAKARKRLPYHHDRHRLPWMSRGMSKEMSKGGA